MCDAGNFGAVGITKSITIDCTGTNGGIVSVPGGPGVDIATAGVDVTLRGLSVDGGSNVGGFIGVRMANGNRLNVEDCRISGYAFGITIQPTGSVAVRVALTRVQVERSITGIVANGTTSTGSIVVQVHDSVVANKCIFAHITDHQA